MPTPNFGAAQECSSLRQDLPIDQGHASEYRDCGTGPAHCD